MSKHKIVIGDSRKLNLIPDKSVQLIVTSPPYWQLKDYGTESQIGFNDSYEEYINNLNLVWKECYRVLSDGCRLCINIGDQFARSVYYGRYKVIPIRTEIIRFCETLGMDYMGAIIWQKATTMNTTGGGAIMGSFPYPRNGILKMDYEFILIFKKLGNALCLSEAIMYSGVYVVLGVVLRYIEGVAAAQTPLVGNGVVCAQAEYTTDAARVRSLQAHT